MTIPLSAPDIGEREIEYVTRVLRSGQLSLGPLVSRFEERFAAYVGSRHAIAVSSGTSALHLCSRALGLGAGNEVLTSSFSFVASANCALYEGASPVFADIDPLTLNLSPREIRMLIEREYAWDSSLRRLTNRRTGRALKALLPVHIFGVPCEMDAIGEIAREFGLAVIEDACEALGARWGGRSVGTFGAAGVFAFYPNKQITTAEGGVIVTDDAHLAALCRSLRNQGRDDESGSLRHVRLGYNYRLSDLHCALGLAQLDRIEDLLAARARVAALYSRELANIPELVLPQACTTGSAASARSWFVYVVRAAVSEPARLRDSLMAGLRRRGIGCQAYFPAIHLQPYFRAMDAEAAPPLPCTEAASNACLALPFSSRMSEADVREVCAAIREIICEVHLARSAQAAHAAPA
ncbi:MAG TPA: DegT/DnrJ/EryC1/StrS family aminotransferase [Candidatus Acidoferrales bacterium]|nr:DegT/DnrJ/EryC1/StrS family aminotransferase [Candidatus Acidoferrales bacterium]